MSYCTNWSTCSFLLVLGGGAQLSSREKVGYYAGSRVTPGEQSACLLARHVTSELSQQKAGVMPEIKSLSMFGVSKQNSPGTLEYLLGKRIFWWCQILKSEVFLCCGQHVRNDDSKTSLVVNFLRTFSHRDWAQKSVCLKPAKIKSS